MLGGAVVVDEDGAGADVGALTNRHVAQVADVVGLALLADGGLFQLDEVTDLGARADVRLGPQMTERSHDRLLLDHRLGKHAVRLELYAIADSGRTDLAAGADDAVAADLRCHVDDDVGIDDRIGPDGHGVVDVRRRRIQDGDSREHVAVHDAPPLDRRHRRQLPAVVDAMRFVGIDHADSLDPAARAGQQSDDVGQVVFALIVVGLHLIERAPQPAAVEAVDAGVDLGDALLVVGGIPILDDALDLPALSQHPAVPVRPVDHRRQNGGGGARRGVVTDQALDGLDGQERHVARQHEDGTVGGLALDARLEYSVAGAEALALLDDGHPLADDGSHAIAVGADDEDDAIGQGPRETERIGDEGTTTELVKNLWLAGAHPLALAGRENHRRQSLHAVPFILAFGCEPHATSKSPYSQGLLKGTVYSTPHELLPRLT